MFIQEVAILLPEFSSLYDINLHFNIEYELLNHVFNFECIVRTNVTN
jgi:hypothetical protein